MSEEEKKAAEIEQTLKDAKARKDAEAETGGKIDKILAGLDAMNTKCDGLAARMDSFEAAGKKTDDETEGVPADPEARADATRKRQDALAGAQARWDSVYTAFAERAPMALAGETELAYRKRLTHAHQHHSPAFAKVDLGPLPADAFKPVEDLVYADAMKAAANPGELSDGSLREVITVDQRTGHRRSEFFGSNGHTFIRDIKARPRRVVRFLTTPHQSVA